MELTDFSISLDMSQVNEDWILSQHEYLRDWIFMTYIYIKSRNLSDADMSELHDHEGVQTFDCKTRFKVLQLADSLQKRYLPFSILDIQNKDQEHLVMIEVYNFIQHMLSQAEEYYGELSEEGQQVRQKFSDDREYTAQLVYDFAKLERALQS